jgi:hypothetical protein
VPANATLPVRPGCGFPENAPTVPGLLQKAQQLLQGLVH